MTKALTSVAALQLIEQGRLQLDQTVASVLPEFGALQLLEGFDGDEPRLRKLSREPTIQHLLTHTSGLSYWFTNPDLLRWHEVTGAPDPFTGLRKCLDTPLIDGAGRAVGVRRQHRMAGAGGRGGVGPAARGYLGEHVFTPLGMADATFAPSDAQRARLMDIHQRTADGGLEPSALRPARRAGACVRRRGSFRDRGRLHAVPARFAARRRAGRRPDPADRDGRADVHRPPRGHPSAGVMESALPELTHPVPSLPFKQGWGLGLHLLLEDVPDMRRAGSGDWAGLFNCYYWVDPKSGITAAIFTQLLPFFDPQMVDTLLAVRAGRLRPARRRDSRVAARRRRAARERYCADDVAGERGGRASRLRGLERGRHGCDS